MKFKRFLMFVFAVLLIAFCAMQAACGSENSAFVQGYAWEDANQDGLINQTEIKLGNVEVCLYSDTGSLISTTTTSNEGYYSFMDLQDGRYYVQFATPSNYQIVTHLDPIAVDPATGKSENFIISDTSRSVTVGTGMKLPSSNVVRNNVTPALTQDSVSITASEDTTASQYNPTSNYGSGENLFLQDNSQVYLRFPLDQLPDNFTLISASLDLFIRNSSNPADALAAISYPDQSSYWMEGSLTWNNMPSQASNAPAFYSQLASNSGQNPMDSFDVTGLLQSYMQENPDAPQFDIMLSYYQGEYMAQQWYSREGLYPPQLSVTYSYSP